MCESPVDPTAPVMLAWEAFRSTEAYENAKRWAASPRDTEGSLWRAFLEGYSAAVAPAPPAPSASTDPWRACGCADPDNCEHVFTASPAADEVREALAAARELLAAVRTGHLASIGAERNVYVPQIGVAWLTPLADKIELGVALAARGGAG